MAVGGALNGASGGDLWGSLANGDMAGYLAAAGEAKTLLVANHTSWILGVLTLGMAGAMMAEMCGPRRIWTQAAMVCFRTAVPLAIVSFIAMLVLAVQIAPDTSETAVSIAKVVGWIGARGDDLATALIVGAGPLFISLAGRGDWIPTWLLTWGYLTGIVGLFSIVILYIPALAPYGLIIVPVGLGWMISAGVVLLRRSKVA
jgi:hypothetical protein